MVCLAHSRADACQHHDLDFLTGKEGVSQDHSQLALSERHMLSLTLTTLSATFLVQCSDTLFERQQA